MAGCIVGFAGPQRSGKTLKAFMYAKHYHDQGIPVYTNMHIEGFHNLKSLMDLPINYEPKVLLLDEIYFFLDSRLFSDNANATIFLNTIGKQNILFLFTTINYGMVEKRLRDQMNYYFYVKSDQNQIYYRIHDNFRDTYKDLAPLVKSEGLFKKLNYNTLQIPNYVDCNLKDFIPKIEKFNESHFKINKKTDYKFNERKVFEL